MSVIFLQTLKSGTMDTKQPSLTELVHASDPLRAWAIPWGLVLGEGTSPVKPYTMYICSLAQRFEACLRSTLCHATRLET